MTKEMGSKRPALGGSLEGSALEWGSGQSPALLRVSLVISVTGTSIGRLRAWNDKWRSVPPPRHRDGKNCQRHGDEESFDLTFATRNHRLLQTWSVNLWALATGGQPPHGLLRPEVDDPDLPGQRSERSDAHHHDDRDDVFHNAIVSGFS